MKACGQSYKAINYSMNLNKRKYFLLEWALWKGWDLPPAPSHPSHPSHPQGSNQSETIVFFFQPLQSLCSVSVTGKWQKLTPLFQMYNS